MNIPIFIAGDENILPQAAVSFHSILKHNGDVFDFYIFTDVKKAREKINEQVLNKLSELNVNIIDNTKLEIYSDLAVFNCFGRWPKHVYYNYLAPLYFKDRGYTYAIKVDYDILCVGKYNLDEILPTEDEILTISLRSGLFRFVKNKEKNYRYNFFKYRTVNAGFIVFNLNGYKRYDIFGIFKRLYNEISSTDISEYVEQFVLGCVQCVRQKSFKELPLKYNYRPGYAISDISGGGGVECPFQYVAKTMVKLFCN